MNQVKKQRYNGHSIRDAHPDDAQELLEIYTPHIEKNANSFETKLPTKQDFSLRIEENLKSFPWLVLEIDGVIAGYCYACTYRSRAAFDWSVEASVYISDHFQRQGVAKALYVELFKILKRQGIANIYAVITIPNEGSISLHESFGFSHIGNFKNTGYKHGKWWDVGWWQLTLQLPAPPQPIQYYPAFKLKESTI